MKHPPSSEILSVWAGHTVLAADDKNVETLSGSLQSPLKFSSPKKPHYSSRQSKLCVLSNFLHKPQTLRDTVKNKWSASTRSFPCCGNILRLANELQEPVLGNRSSYAEDVSTWLLFIGKGNTCPPRLSMIPQSVHRFPETPERQGQSDERAALANTQGGDIWSAFHIPAQPEREWKKEKEHQICHIPAPKQKKRESVWEVGAVFPVTPSSFSSFYFDIRAEPLE